MDDVAALPLAAIDPLNDPNVQNQGPVNLAASGTTLPVQNNSSQVLQPAIPAAVIQPGSSRQLGSILAIAAALSVNVGKVCQKRGTQDLPLLQCNSTVLRMYVANYWWLLGFAMDVGGALLTLTALAMAPVSVVQPILGCGPGIVAVFSYFLTSDRLRTSDWAASGLCVLGTIGVGLTSVDSGGGPEEMFVSVAVLLLLFFMLSATGSEMMYRSRLLPLEVASSVSAGVCFGLSACSTRCGMKLAAGNGAAAPLAPLLGVAGSLVLTSTGFVAQTRGLKDGRALSVVTYSNLIALLVAVIFGLLALSEPLPQTATGLAGRVVALSLLAGGSY
eukprot:CAMPEP_0181308686 /NCGR_PEP_ID=MMETSP1101-20121128/11603_1 /TAXON_ID=46948 /ORGANISM="Rhodomonas abbreviata, Strain Caron Lab Isolate" /LENGTH=331 /DNA_ID=CAMNT_0023415101 /DNA_START=239 /DNA_END=1231 /DNA_ORIENTATION=+